MLQVPKTKNGNGRAQTVEYFKISNAVVSVRLITIILSREIDKPPLFGQFVSERKLN